MDLAIVDCKIPPAQVSLKGMASFHGIGLLSSFVVVNELDDRAQQ